MMAKLMASHFFAGGESPKLFSQEATRITRVEDSKFKFNGSSLKIQIDNLFNSIMNSIVCAYS